MTTPRVTVPVEPTEAMRLVPDRVLTETLYWMARAYERVHSMPRVSDTGLANKIEAAKADLGRARDASPILSNSAAPAPEGGAVDDLIDRFATALKEKLHDAEAKYGHNDAWMRDDWQGDLVKQLSEHVAKGDPRDVAAYCAFAWHHGWSVGSISVSGENDLATREEAPAEAGERDYPAEFEAWWATYRHRNRDVADYSVKKQIAFDAFYHAALRAQPQAREDAQPVAWRRALSPIDGHFTYSNVGDDGWQPLYTHPAPAALRVAVADIAAERQRQVDAEGWSAERDDEYTDRSLAHAAAAYALGFDLETRPEVITDDVSGGRGDSPVWRHREIRVPASWPTSWAAEWWKPSDARRDLVKAGALIVAEIERLDRAALQAEQGAK